MRKIVILILAIGSKLAFSEATRFYNDTGCLQILDSVVVAQCKKTVKLIGHFDTFSPFKNTAGGIILESQNQESEKLKIRAETKIVSNMEGESGTVKIIQVPVIIKENNEDIRRIAAATETLAIVSIISLVASIAITLISVIIISK